MFNKIRALWTRWGTEGMKWPFLHDPVEGKPSITLFYPYITFTLAVMSVIALHFYSGLLTATLVTIGFWVIAVILYMIRKIHKANFNLEQKSIEIEAEDEPAKTEAAGTPESVSTESESTGTQGAK